MIGGDLSPQRLLTAYQGGIFPWFEPGCPILWWSPNPRLVIYPQDFKVSRSLTKSLKKPYRFTIDTDFKAVINACATVSGRIGNTWISKDMLAAYCELHEMGYAHSFEIWNEQNQLIGGLYGVSLGRAFFGESMFHHERDASKIAFYHLCQTMLAWKFDFIDCQMPTAHLMRLGAKIISRKEFLYRLGLAVQKPTCAGLWSNNC
ncbi:leucyl/phenylalanyl-tRNA--protein transferase [Legionella dresdenensis]|uniref:Leucyl/phenylalanyl-tRNA--protein transferase n=1 Tax=Legionella dresdenensis TaxID=450200 RepID=A0ABV8CCF8_9GAMM